MSKFSVPRSSLSGRLFPSARSLTPSPRLALTQRLDPLTDLSLRGRIEVELEQARVRVDRNLRLLQRVGGLGEREERLLIRGLELDDLLVRRDRRRSGALVVRRRSLQRGAGLGALGAGDGILRERLAELPRGGLEGGAHARLRLRERGQLRLLEIDVRLAQLEVTEAAQRGHVLRAK